MPAGGASNTVPRAVGVGAGGIRAAGQPLKACAAARRNIRLDCGSRRGAKARVARRDAPTSGGKGEGFAQRLGVTRDECARPAPRFPRAKTEHVAYSRRPPGARHVHNASSSRACWRAKLSMSASRRSHLTSGWRRTTPAGRARHVGEDAVERPPVPPLRRRRRHRRRPRAPARRQDAAARGFRARASGALVAVERDELDVRELEQVRGLAAGRGAGVEHALAAAKPQQRRRELRARVLHRERPLGEPRQLARRASAGSTMIPAPPPASRRSRRAANAASSASRVATRRFTRSASGAARCPRRASSCQSSGYSRCTRSIHHRGCDQRATGSRKHRLVQRFALAQEPAQQRIDERLGRGTRQRRRRVHRMIDDGERRRARVFELVDRDGDETVERRIGDRLRRELRAPAHRACPNAAACRTQAPARARGGVPARPSPPARTRRARPAASSRPAPAGRQRG